MTPPTATWRDRAMFVVRKFVIGYRIAKEPHFDREATARRLGFARVAIHSMDAVADRDWAIEFTSVAALVTGADIRWKLTGTKTLSPTGLYLDATVFYRLVLT